MKLTTWQLQQASTDCQIFTERKTFFCFQILLVLVLNKKNVLLGILFLTRNEYSIFLLSCLWEKINTYFSSWDNLQCLDILPIKSKLLRVPVTVFNAIWLLWAHLHHSWATYSTIISHLHGEAHMVIPRKRLLFQRK